jgi:predicted alpha/beta-fold hydrolase
VTRHTYIPAWWIPGPHLRTLWGKFFRRADPVPTRRERWETADGDFLDLERLDARPGAPRLLLLHGLEGTSRSHYAQGTLAEARRRGWGADMLIFRSCGGELNRTRRFYHSGETTDLALVVERVAAEHPNSPLVLAGFSLGGNVLLKFLGERGSDLPPQVHAAAAVSVPYDLGRGSRHISRGFARVYERHFLRSLRRKAYAKLERFPDLVPREHVDRARTLWDFDDVVTAPVHGFAGAADYYSRSSAIRFLGGIRVPTLLLSAVDDPFLPAAVLDNVGAAARGNPALQVEFIERGGHVGFISGRVPWRPFYYAEWRVAEFLAAQLSGGVVGSDGTAVARERRGPRELVPGNGDGESGRRPVG